MNVGVLAFVGDAYFHLETRARLAAASMQKSGALHLKATAYVSAVSQARIVDRIKPFLNGFELDLMRRARNADSNTPAKNASLAEYKKSTSLEAVVGYYYMTGGAERLGELMKIIFETENT